nr:hypothetical protein [Nocardioides speluncae]
MYDGSPVTREFWAPYPLRYFPTKPVRYPARASDPARVLESSKEAKPYGGSWVSTLWLWAYCPVKYVARAGQHSG